VYSAVGEASRREGITLNRIETYLGKVDFQKYNGIILVDSIKRAS